MKFDMQQAMGKSDKESCQKTKGTPPAPDRRHEDG